MKWNEVGSVLQPCRGPDEMRYFNACLNGNVDARTKRDQQVFSGDACGQQSFASEIHLFF
jgi:hypothetical protein